MVGKPLYVNSITEEGVWLEYARIYIELDIDSPCPDSIEVSLPNGEHLSIKLEYFWKPSKCTNCKPFSHGIGECILLLREEKMKVVEKAKAKKTGEQTKRIGEQAKKES